MAKEIKINPSWRRSPFFAVELCRVEASGQLKIGDVK
jgi:hypothetical protein